MFFLFSPGMISCIVCVDLHSCFDDMLLVVQINGFQVKVQL